jgi:hypothetical protein
MAKALERSNKVPCTRGLYRHQALAGVTGYPSPGPSYSSSLVTARDSALNLFGDRHSIHFKLEEGTGEPATRRLGRE